MRGWFCARVGVGSYQKVVNGIGPARTEALEHRTLLSAGQVDTTFGTNGTVTSNLSTVAYSPNTDAFNAMVRQPDGKLVAVGFDAAGGSDESQLAVLRYNTNGTPDDTFGNAGVFLLPQYETDATAVAIQSDGDIVVGGYATTYGPSDQFLLARLTPTGALDPTFGSGGIVLTSAAGYGAVSNSRISSIAIQPDGSILAGGYAQSSYTPGSQLPALARYTSAGVLDGTFGNAGLVIGPGTEGGAGIADLSLLPSGQILALGDQPSSVESWTGSIVLSRYNTDGSIDSTFGNGGYAVDTTTTNTTPTKFGVDAVHDAVYVLDVDGTSDDLLKYELSGVRQATFGVGGVVQVGPDGRPVGDIDVQADGDVLVATSSLTDQPLISQVVSRYTPFGAVDESFGYDGSVTLPEGNHNTAAALAVQDGHDIYVGGSQNGDFAVTALYDVPRSDNGAVISGTVYDDQNSSGQITASDPGLPGVTVYIDANGDGRLDAGETSTTTSSNGGYSFAGLPWGYYPLAIVAPAGLTQTFPANAQQDFVSTYDGSPATANFAVGITVPPNSIGGTVYADANGNGTQDAGETGLVGWQVYLDNNNDGKFDAGDVATTTDSNGRYLFTNLSPAIAAYSVRVTLPAGYVITNLGATANPSQGVSIHTGNSYPHVDFGVSPHAFLSGLVYEDPTGTGNFASTDAAVAGATVYLDVNDDGKLDSGDLSAVSNATGEYQIGNVPAGTYVLREVPPAGQQISSPQVGSYTVVVPATPAGLSYWFGDTTHALVGSATLAGEVYNDANGDGQLDNGEAGLANITVYLDTNDDGVLEAGEPSQLTGAGGTYSFTGLVAGTYAVRAVLPSGWTQTAPAGNGATTLTVSPGEGFSNIDIGQQKIPTTGGTVTGSVTAGGVGVAYETVYLDANNDSKLDDGELSTSSTATGAYTFLNVPAGAYVVRQVLPAGYTQVTPGNNTGDHITVGNGGTVSGQNFTDALPPAGGTVSGVVTAGGVPVVNETVYLDANNNSQLDTGERALVTDGNGAFSFTHVTPGAYVVRQVLLNGYKQLTPAGGLGIHITVASGGSLTGENFTDSSAAAPPPPPTGGSVTGTVTAGGKPVANEAVYLDANNNSKLDTGELSTTTNASGVYSFSNVPAGAYIVRQVLLAGTTQTTPSGGTGLHLTVANGSVLTGQNFTDTAPVANAASIAGQVFNDVNGNGKLDASETGFAGWTLYLDLGNTGSYVAGDPTVQTTDASGDYLFTGLAAGTYIVRVERPGNYKQTTPANNLGQHVTLAAAQKATGILFGEQLIA